MVREGYGTSGEGNGTTVGFPKHGGVTEVLPLLTRDANFSSVPGSDAEPRASDAGSGNEGLKKSARGRTSLHGEVLLANKTLKKKPYKSLGWSLIAAAASGILVACMVAAAVVPFSSIGPDHAVDRDTAAMIGEKMGFDDTAGLSAIGGGEKSGNQESVDAESPSAARKAPLTPDAFKLAVEQLGGFLTESGKWRTALVVVPAVYDEWDVVDGDAAASGIPTWATPDKKSLYSMAPLYQRREPSEPNFVPNRGYETGAFLKFVIDHYDNLPEITAFVSGDFAETIGSSELAKRALADVAAAVESSSSKLGSESSKSSKTSQIAGYQPLIVDSSNFLQSRSPGELVQMWKQQRWGWEDIMGDSAGAAAAHLSRCWRAVAADFETADVVEDSLEDSSEDSLKSSKSTKQSSQNPRAALGQFFFSSSSKKSRVATEGETRIGAPAVAVSKQDKRELKMPPVSVSLYPGSHFAVTKKVLRNTPLKTWESAYGKFVEKGVCVEDEANETGDEIRNKFDLGVSLEFLSHVIFGGAALDAGVDARCCGTSCVFEDQACSELGAFQKTAGADEYDVASFGGPRFDADETRMLRVEGIISRYNGWNLRELREERKGAGGGEGAEAVEDVIEDVEEASEDVEDDVEDIEDDVKDSSDVVEGVEDASYDAEDAIQHDSSDDSSSMEFLSADLGAAEPVWERFVASEKAKDVGGLGGLRRELSAKTREKAELERSLKEVEATIVDLHAKRERLEEHKKDGAASLGNARVARDERRVANLSAKLEKVAALVKDVQTKKRVAAVAARNLRQKLATAKLGSEAEAEAKTESKPAVAKVGAAEDGGQPGVASLALPPRRRPAQPEEVAAQ